MILKADSTVMCVPCMLESMFVMSHFLFKKMADLEDIYVNWLNFVYCLKFKQINKILRLKAYARMFREPVCKISYP